MEYDTFDKMLLKDEVLRGVYGYGLEKPSAIQQHAIVALRGGRDLVAQAQSGTGKTVTFTVGTLERLDRSLPFVQALLLAPTRELALQTGEVFKRLNEYVRAELYVCIGGTMVRQDIQALQTRPIQVVVGTPGRVHDMVQRGFLRTADLKLVVLDEADEMLSRGFKEQIHNIFKHLPETTQVCLFSATMPLEILDLTDKFMKDPQRILIKKDELTLEGIRQFYINVGNDDRWKFETLCDLYETLSLNQTLIYCNTKRKAEELQAQLQQRDFAVSCIHSGLDGPQREETMNEFRKGQTRVLISTDLLARGIDIQQVSMVVNYDLPLNRENYIHRIGRSGRFGRKGVAINFLLGNSEDMQCIKDIESFYSTEIKEMPTNIADYFQ
jgi:translation initiation factor 4A